MVFGRIETINAGHSISRPNMPPTLGTRKRAATRRTGGQGPGEQEGQREAPKQKSKAALAPPAGRKGDGKGRLHQVEEGKSSAAARKEGRGQPLENGTREAASTSVTVQISTAQRSEKE